MKITVAALLFALVIGANAQGPRQDPEQKRVYTLDFGGASGKADTLPAVRADSQLHEEVMELLELSGARDRVEKRMSVALREARRKVKENCPRCTSQFAREWTERMRDRFRAEDIIAITAKAYEKYFTEDEIAELIELQKRKKAHLQAVPSPELRQKVRDVLPDLMGEVVGDCAKLGVRLGTEVADEIQQEHPEYLRPAGGSQPAQ